MHPKLFFRLLLGLTTMLSSLWLGAYMAMILDNTWAASPMVLTATIFFVLGTLVVLSAIGDD